MTDKKTELRRQAEEKASHLAPIEGLKIPMEGLKPENMEAMSSAETRQMLHELRVHQIELEIQNEEMRQSQAELKAARARYFDLYDLAPVGYCTVSEKGLILEANLTAATLLGETRSALVQQPLSRFILNEDQDIFYQLRKQLLDIGSASSLQLHSGQAGQAGAMQACELRMLKKDETTFWAHLEAAVQHPATGEAQAGTPELRIALSDITLRKHAEEALQRVHDELEQRVAARTEELMTSSQQLEQTNTALHVLLSHREDELRETENKMVANLRKLVIPYVGELRKLHLNPSHSNYLDIIEANLQQVISPFMQNLAARYSNFTPREIQIANLIVEDKTSKEIADIINAGKDVIDFHRNNIRKKLGLIGKESNLRTFLLTLSKK